MSYDIRTIIRGVGRLISYGDDDFVLLDGVIAAATEHILTMTQLGKQKRTMSDLRSVGIVFEAFRIDNEALPGGPVDQLEPVGRIRDDVQPIYIRTLPLTDGWGHALVYWTDGTTYRIASPGEDGEFETDYTTLPGSGAFDALDFGRDIVFGDGAFEQWPESGVNATTDD